MFRTSFSLQPLLFTAVFVSLFSSWLVSFCLSSWVWSHRFQTEKSSWPPCREERGKKNNRKRTESRSWHLFWSAGLLPAPRLSEVWDKVIFRWKPDFFPLLPVHTLPAQSDLDKLTQQLSLLCLSAVLLLHPFSLPSLLPRLHGSWMFRHGSCSWKALN